MCDLSNEFKLCTCDFEPSNTKYTWKLFRKKSTVVQVIEGEYYIPYLDWDNSTLAERVEFYLNKAQDEKRLFDKKIDLYDNDRLVFYRESKILFQFNYEMYRWWLNKSKRKPKDAIISKGDIKTTSKKNTTLKKRVLVDFECDIIGDFKKRRAFFKRYLEMYHVQKYVCESCGFPIFDDEGAYDICRICDWEDNGYNDEHEDWPNHSAGEKLTLTDYRIQSGEEVLEQPKTVQDFKRIIKAIYRYDRFEKFYYSHEIFSMDSDKKAELDKKKETALTKLKEELRILI